MKCNQCKNFSLRALDMAKHGYGLCFHKQSYEFQSAVIERDCGTFQATGGGVEQVKRSQN